MKQTAVEWLEEQTRTKDWHSLKRGDIIQKAKEMEKQQIIDARENGFSCEENWRTDSETYYNEIFKK